MSRTVLWVGLISALACGSARAQDPVYFADGDLEALVEKALWVSDPTPEDMLSLTSLSADSESVSSLTGLEYAENLRTLRLTHCEISSLSPLSGLTNLYTLVLNNNRISSVSALSKLTRLHSLDLHDNEVGSISALRSLTSLETLILRYNEIGSISALSDLSQLKFLDLRGNNVSNISALTGLTSLTNVNLHANPLNADACSTYIPQILANNPGIDLKYDACTTHEIVISSTAGGSVIAPGEGTFSFENGETLYLEAQADPGYEFVQFSGCHYTTDNPTLLTITQSGQIQANFVSTQSSLYVDDDADDDPGPNDANASDPLENGTSDHPFDRIQEAIDGAADGTGILVRPGTYHENLDLLGKRLQLLGADGDASDYPVLDGPDGAAVVSFIHGEDPNCLLSGFVVTGGVADLAGAIYCSDSSPTIVNCLVVGNHATDANGAAVTCERSEATLINCTIADNRGGSAGAAIATIDSNVTLLNCIVWNNSPRQICLTGTSDPLVAYSTLAGQWSGAGNLDANPLFASPGFWQKTDGSISLDADDEDAVWIAGDYHLMSQTGRWDPADLIWIADPASSPCIDAGDPASAADDEPEPNGARINMGVYGGTAQASMSP